jgi:hypothetical protein
MHRKHGLNRVGNTDRHEVGRGTATELFKLSMTLKMCELKELEQLIAAAKMGYPVYVQLYDDLNSKEHSGFFGLLSS